LLVGETVAEPDVPLALKPEPVQLVASVLDHESVADPPEVMDVGDAERDAVGAGSALTDTVTLSESEPPAPVQVTV